MNVIKEFYPQYHVDYFNRQGSNERWSDRVTDDEPSEYEMNLYNFYTIVYGKLMLLLNKPFVLDGEQLRIPISDFDETLRECLVNCLAHADYVLAYPSVKIEVFEGWFKFNNPGKMLISKSKFMTGGDSRPRNEIIMKLFRLLGASERQGFGGPLIFKTAIANDLRIPDILTDIEHTEVRVWSIDLVDSYPNLNGEEKIVLNYIVKNGSLGAIRELVQTLGITEYKIRKSLDVLEEKKLIYKDGKARATRYNLQIESIEMVTRLQMFVDALKRSL